MGKDVTADHINAYRAAIAAAAGQGPVAFQNWFCRSSSLTQTRVRGHWDFSLHILTPAVCAAIDDPETKIALEIGYGGGRLLNAACGFFAHAIGVDLHNESLARDFIRDCGNANFDLLTGDGATLPVADSSVHFVYSFIVLMHLQSFDAFVSYLQETFRVLKHGGIAQLYFGRYHREFCFFEYAAPVNNSSLLVNVETAKQLSVEIGFDVLGVGRSYKNAPNGFPNQFGQQDYLTLGKK